VIITLEQIRLGKARLGSVNNFPDLLKDVTPGVRVRGVAGQQGGAT